MGTKPLGGGGGGLKGLSIYSGYCTNSELQSDRKNKPALPVDLSYVRSLILLGYLINVSEKFSFFSSLSGSGSNCFFIKFETYLFILRVIYTKTPKLFLVNAVLHNRVSFRNKNTHV